VDAAAAGLSIDEVASDAAVIMFGGIETVEGMISTAALHLFSDVGRRPDPEDDEALAAVVDESLRLEPAAARVDRYATRDTVLDGARIAAGELVIASLSAANRDPAAFADPDLFRPGRPGGRDHLAFARGPHACLAASLARRQGVVLLAELLRLPGVRLDRAASTAVTGLVFRKPERVVLRWDAGPRRGQGASVTVSCGLPVAASREA
jgi:cytochrome P450